MGVQHCWVSQRSVTVTGTRTFSDEILLLKHLTNTDIFYMNNLPYVKLTNLSYVLFHKEKWDKTRFSDTECGQRTNISVSTGE